MKKIVKSTFAILLATALAVPSLNANAETFSLNGSAKPFYGHLDDGHESTGIVESTGEANYSTALPKKYDPRKQSLGYTLPAVRNQGVYGTCWAHAALGALEISTIKNKKAASTLNLSEVQLVSASYYHPGVDPIGLLKKDNYGMKINIDKADMGGTSELAANALINRAVVTAEKTAAGWVYTPANMNKFAYTKLPQAYAYRKQTVVMRDYVELKNPTINDVKAAIMKYGAVKVSYAAGYYDCENPTTHGYYVPVNVGTNHDVVLVGWDDSFSKNNFGEYTPQGNGAWILRNSWGTDNGDNGYYYLSYYDKTACEFTIFEGAVANKDPYNRIYQYDSMPYNRAESKAMPVGNIFKAAANEVLGTVSFETACRKGDKYTVDIYVGCSSDPKSGKKVSSTSGTFAYTSDYCNKFVVLKKAVNLKKGQKFAIVVTTNGKSTIKYDDSIKINFTDGRSVVAQFTAKADNSSKVSYKYPSGKATVSSKQYCIKGFTKKK